MSHEPRVLYEFEAGRKTIRATVNTYRGTPYLDIREWYEPAPGQPLAPTKKGVSIPRDYLDELKEAVEAFATEFAQPGVTRVARRAR